MSAWWTKIVYLRIRLHTILFIINNSYMAESMLLIINNNYEHVFYSFVYNLQ